MSPEVAAMIQTVALEAIKILGPAMLTYLAATAQFKSRLQELETSNRFKSREHLFAYYQKRQDRLEKDGQSLSSGIGTILGLAAGLGDNARLSDEPLSSYMVLIQSFIVMAPVEIAVTRRDMTEKKLEGSTECLNLIETSATLERDFAGTTVQELRDCAGRLIAVYSALQRCNLLLLEKKIEDTLALAAEGS